MRTQSTIVYLAILATSAVPAVAQDSLESNALADQVEALQQENRELRERLDRQERLLHEVTEQLQDGMDEGPDDQGEATAVGLNRPGQVILGGTGAAAFFHTDSEGAYPNAEFIVDELRLFVEATVHNDVYAFVELNLATREEHDLNARLGEAYLDLENVSKLWGVDHMMSVRVGRMDIPFGEEYLYRDAINNPLISHSLMDFWGIDEGIEIYGALGGVTYVLAVQNGSIETTRDLTGDKSVAGRLGYDINDWLHVGLSAMRTGDLDAMAEWSEMWIGDAFYRSIGSTNTAQFHANLFQGDVRVGLPHGHMHLAGGYSRYDDDDSSADNGRDIWFYSAEVVHDLPWNLYLGGRFSQMFLDEGYPIVGQGAFGPFFFGPLTEEIWRLSLGLGYRWSDSLVLKTEYSFERGKLVTGTRRDQEDMVSAQAAWRF